eukprot:1134397-Prymnesium_polylepis.1
MSRRRPSSSLCRALRSFRGRRKCCVVVEPYVRKANRSVLPQGRCAAVPNPACPLLKANLPSPRDPKPSTPPVLQPMRRLFSPPPYRAAQGGARP